jgi:hypothetical protein
VGMSVAAAITGSAQAAPLTIVRRDLAVRLDLWLSMDNVISSGSSAADTADALRRSKVSAGDVPRYLECIPSASFPCKLSVHGGE